MDNLTLNEVLAYVAIIMNAPFLTAFLSLTVGWMVIKFIVRYWVDSPDIAREPQVSLSSTNQTYEPEPIHDPSGERCNCCGAPMGSSSICDYCGRKN